ncbi:hypothetical protein Ocin01_04792 [Orchesella cincta]|uniref:Uncharacterized protein n=1 Tax=Orchesella cincta TaxID=48709 RepID=A0A1D2N9J1_ORCCI|nr:hypothetical protein Ocin01_04792 [Orchesella cincta]
MQSSYPNDIDATSNEIEAVRQAIADRLQLQNKLMMLEKLITDMINTQCDSRGTTFTDPTSSGEGQSASGDQSSSFPDANLALRQLQQRAGSEQRRPGCGGSPATSSNCYSTSDGTSPESSTLAEMKVRVNFDSETTSSPYSSSRQTSTPYNSSGSSNNSQCSNRARRLAELTFRVFTKGFENADEHTLHEMSAHLRELIQDRSSHRHCS